MTIQHGNFAELATRLISAHGRKMDLVVRNKTGPEDDPKITPVNTSIAGVQTKFSAMEKNGGLVERGDIKVLIDASVKPTVDMRLLDNGISHSIIDVQEVKPGATSIIYKIHARA